MIDDDEPAARADIVEEGLDLALPNHEFARGVGHREVSETGPRAPRKHLAACCTTARSFAALHTPSV